MIKRVGEAIRRETQYKWRPGAYAVLERGGFLLLTHQAEPIPEFQLPGGGIDPGEHTIPALHREIREETGWSVSNLRRVGAFRRFTYMPEYSLWAEKLCHVFYGQPTFCISDPSEPGHTAIWTTPAAAAELVANDGDRMFIKRLFG